MTDMEGEVNDILREYFPMGVPIAHFVEAALPVAVSLEELASCGVESTRSP